MAYEDIISRMTLEEKCALLQGATAFGARPNPSKGIPELHFSDGPHGLRVQGEGANHLGIGGSLPATCFPTAVTISNTWEPELAEEIGVAPGTVIKYGLAPWQKALYGASAAIVALCALGFFKWAKSGKKD